jgi:hypothetical protein
VGPAPQPDCWVDPLDARMGTFSCGSAQQKTPFLVGGDNQGEGHHIIAQFLQICKPHFYVYPKIMFGLYATAKAPLTTE